MKKTIALLTGGVTSERVVSVKSAESVARHLDPEKYNVYKIMINETGWFYEPVNSEKIEVDKNDFSINFKGEKIKFDCAFIVIHGAPGEDGKLQGYFDMLGIPYTTCNALTSAITMNKSYTKAVVSNIKNLNLAKSLLLFKENYDVNQVNALRLPYFVKPNNGGSSIGMSKVKRRDELQAALDKAFNEDDQILIEEFVDGREFSVGVYKTKGKIVTLPATEVIPPKEFFDFEAKYTPGATEEITPGRMTDEERAKVEQVVTDVYRTLNCKGAVRIDYFLQKNTGDFYFIEINTVPGQTNTSFIPLQVGFAGLNLQDFYSEIIEESFKLGNSAALN